MSYQPPTDILEVLSTIEYENALEAGDPRYVDTREARGSQKTLDRLARKFGLLLSDGRFVPPAQKHVLFFGHTGSGKTTELRHYAQALSGAGKFFVAEVDITVTLDRNNLQYADTLMAMAQSLLQRLFDEGVSVPGSALEALKKWFDERVLSADESKEFAAEIKSGGEAKLGLPFLIKLFTRFTAALRANATYKESLRRTIRNSFTQLADAFNDLLRHSEEALAEHRLGKRVLFIIDGTDKLRGEDTRRFFVEDAEQLLAIAGHVVYTAPLGLKYEGGLTGKLDSDLMLPMIKLRERDGAPYQAGLRAIRDILLLRADRSLFASDNEIQALIEHSGGHPRELLRLLKLCCEFVEGPAIDAVTAGLAITQLASEYRRFLEPEDYAALASIDTDPIHAGNDERTRKLLYNLALLEYNDGTWRRSHPVVQTLEGYQRAAAALSNRASS
jgi:energy-coupling factor transporter ATP-binding protein EcfA2